MNTTPHASPTGTAVHAARIYAGLQGDLLLDNERVQVQRLVLDPGQSTGMPVHQADGLLVFVRGGVLRHERSGRAVWWRDGRVSWRTAAQPGDALRNDGEHPVEMVWVTPKAADPGATPTHAYLDYPLIPGEDLLENERVIVQRFHVEPGQWEGVHAHHPDMLFIHVRGGHWGARSIAEGEHAYDAPTADGEIGWMPTIPLAEGHESGNIGTTDIDLIWVTIK
jgi:predicted metal-dependent enzyme (double-stranded beta helix superfamily)